MPATQPRFDVSLAVSEIDVIAAQRLRYDVFVSELGATGPLVDHKTGREADVFDKHADHLILRDRARVADQQVVGVYRLLSGNQAAKAGQFSCEGEYDLGALRSAGKRIVELSRSCLHADYRGGTAMFHLWQALADHIAAREVDILFGVASFHGQDISAYAAALAMLFETHASPYKVTSRQPVPLPSQSYNRKTALQQTPALIKAYLRLGGAIGQGVYVDADFNTTDVCMILETDKMNARQKAIYTR